MSRSFPRKELTAWWLVHTTGGRKGHLGYLLLKRPVTYWRIFCLKELFCQLTEWSLFSHGLHNLVCVSQGLPVDLGALCSGLGASDLDDRAREGDCAASDSPDHPSLSQSPGWLAFAHSLLGFLSSLYITFPSVLSSLLPLPSVKSFLWNCS